MADSLHFDLPAFEALVGTLKRGQTAIVDHLQALIKRITLLCEGWTGAAREAYLIAQVQWMQSFAGLIAALKAAAQFIQAARDVYEQAENQIKDAWPA